ncbi:unnamed protein product [Sphenostylis stenocarpa]|uniref:Uncharacterized protein n=1 Tax=Sphenostylis stenocarpa TaxID=92480 RepID=A0AA86T0C6_9FABA|nr:unnamed protein product [Sphenostylis stenocarpa]
MQHLTVLVKCGESALNHVSVDNSRHEWKGGSQRGATRGADCVRCGVAEVWFAVARLRWQRRGMRKDFRDEGSRIREAGDEDGRGGGLAIWGSNWAARAPVKGVGVVLAVVGGDWQGAGGAIRLKGKRQSEGVGIVGAATRGKRGVEEEWKQGSLGERTVLMVDLVAAKYNNEVVPSCGLMRIYKEAKSSLIRWNMILHFNVHSNISAE